MTPRVSKVWTSCYSEAFLSSVEVQVLLRNGLPRFDIIGLPKNMIREGKDRIYSALSHLGIELPSKKILVNLNPADRPKEGSHFDLPILIGILKCLGHLSSGENDKDFYWGELQLDGNIRPLEDHLAHLLFAHQARASRLLLSQDKAELDSLQSFLSPRIQNIRNVADIFMCPSSPSLVVKASNSMDRVTRQWLDEDATNAKWSQLLGSSEQFLFWSLVSLGRHHVLVEGPPGVGKSSWCQALGELQRPLPPHLWWSRYQFQSRQKCRELKDLWNPPFEAPHHSSSRAAIIGGGHAQVLAGSMTRAHLGILFLDELPEYHRDLLEALREPLESKSITIARRGLSQQLPADMQLLAAMNPCGCGYYQSKKTCHCVPGEMYRYRQRVSEPLRDRFHWKVYWKYEAQKPLPEYKLCKLRDRLISAERQPPAPLGHLYLPTRLSARQQRLWLDKLSIYSRWKHCSEIGPTEVREFEDFSAQIEGLDKGHEAISIKRMEGER
ncbi:MAG: hypothetical protein COV44_03410 [Deltaproteobacteria bacterium CG11_big_fil_rev_8_21_14_0_20_45_16]|nr:MAG: hypothetical protein COV44_03410 [Deltaproteobacteria bacterium CG11_big_fil_rev_8_21_14_0_20_45_16]